MTNDLTKGSPLKQILLFSVPFIIGNIFQQFYNIADMVIVGRTLGSNAYAAVGATGGLFWFVTGPIQSLTIGFSALTARYFGAGDNEKIKRTFAASIKLSAIITILFSILSILLARPALELLRTPEDIIDRSYSYLFWIFAGLFATALYNLLSNMIRALGDSRTPLFFLIIACVINIILDVVFIVIFKMDTDGAGLATIVAQLISGILCIIYLVRKQPLLHITKKHFKTDFTLDCMLLNIGVPMAFLNMILSIGSIVMQFVTNGLGVIYVAAQTTGTKIEQFALQPILSFASALSVFVAQNFGANKYTRIFEGIRKTLYVGWIFCCCSIVFILMFGKNIVTLIAGDVQGEVVNGAYIYSLVNICCMFFLVPVAELKSVLQSLGRNFWTTLSGFTEIVGRAGISLIVLALISNTGISDSSGYTIMCFASPAAWVLGLITFLPDYIKTIKYMKKQVALHNEIE